VTVPLTAVTVSVSVSVSVTGTVPGTVTVSGSLPVTGAAVSPLVGGSGWCRCWSRRRGVALVVLEGTG